MEQSQCAPGKPPWEALVNRECSRILASRTGSSLLWDTEVGVLCAELLGWGWGAVSLSSSRGNNRRGLNLCRASSPWLYFSFLVWWLLSKAVAMSLWHCLTALGVK